MSLNLNLSLNLSLPTLNRTRSRLQRRSARAYSISSDSFNRRIWLKLNLVVDLG